MVEQQPPTEGRVLTDEDVERGAEEAWNASFVDAPPYPWSQVSNSDHFRKVARAVLESLPPGPPEPTQGNEWDRATVDAVVEELEEVGREHAASTEADAWAYQAGWDDATRLVRGFKGAARDTGGRSG